MNFLKLALLAFVLPTVAFADLDSRVSKGDLLKQRQYQTNADLTFYVDPLGNDANQCTAVTTDACLTIQGALNKAPKLLRHRVTVNVASGNYAGFTISGFTEDPSVQRATAGIALIGPALTNVTPATGTATGTASAGSAGSNTTFGTLTDGTQTWTVNDFRGKLIEILTGTGAGQIRAIASNTATAITIAGAWTAPTGTSTYAIRNNGAIVTTPAALIPNSITGSAVLSAGIQVVNNNFASSTSTSGGNISIQNIGVATAGAAPLNVSGPVSVWFSQMVTSGGAMSSSAGASLVTSSCAFTSTAQTILVSTGSRITFGSSYLSGTTGATALTGATMQITVSASQINTTSSCMSLNTGAGIGLTATSVRCDCNSGANSAAIAVGSSNPTAGFSPSSITASVNSGLDVTNCTVALSANEGSISTNPGTVLSGNALSYAAQASNGGKIRMQPSLATITSGTADLSLDGATATGSFASLAATYACLTNLATLSSICRL